MLLELGAWVSSLAFSATLVPWLAVTDHESMMVPDQAVHADGTLWVRYGECMFVLRDGDPSPRQVYVPDSVEGLSVLDGAPTVVTSSVDYRRWTVRRRAGDHWHTLATVAAGDEQVAGLCSDGGTLLLVTTNRLVEIVGSSQRAVCLSQELPVIRPKLVCTGERVFAGFDHGEFGGGLWSIERATGEVHAIDREGEPEDPDEQYHVSVTALAFEPWNPSCLALSIGFINLDVDDRILEVCGDGKQRPWLAPIVPSANDPRSDELTRRVPTQPFFGMTPVGNELWATGFDGLFRVAADGRPRQCAMPEFQDFGCLSVSFDLPEVILISTEPAPRPWMIGEGPMIVSR